MEFLTALTCIDFRYLKILGVSDRMFSRLRCFFGGRQRVKGDSPIHQKKDKSWVLSRDEAGNFSGSRSTNRQESPTKYSGLVINAQPCDYISPD